MIRSLPSSGGGGAAANDRVDVRRMGRRRRCIRVQLLRCVMTIDPGRESGKANPATRVDEIKVVRLSLRDRATVRPPEASQVHFYLVPPLVSAFLWCVRPILNSCCIQHTGAFRMNTNISAQLTRLPFLLLLVSSVTTAAGPTFRPPAVPLVACDPYFSIWSPA